MRPEISIGRSVEGARYHKLEHTLWGETGLTVQVHFQLRHDGENLFVRFQVKEPEVLARFEVDGEPVYKDSCAEFFFTHPDKTGYFNFEFNPNGACLACFGADRQERTPIAPGLLQKIRRQPVYNPKEKPNEWKLDVNLPLAELIGRRLDDLRLSANFYKCGDDLTRPHYLAWSRIETGAPDFHRPEFFGLLCFE